MLTIINTPMGEIAISLHGKCFHDGVPQIPIIIDWYLEMVDYGLENDWQFTLNCLGLWIKQEYPDDYKEIVIIIHNFTK